MRLLGRDDARRAMLLERARPGDALWTVADEARWLPLAADAARRLWRPLALAAPVRALAAEAPRWASAIVAASGLPGAPERAVLERAGGWARELAAAPPGPAVLVHQDLHGGNILRSARGWIAIDPKPLRGEPAFGVASLVRDRRWELAREARPGRRLGDRVDALAGLLDLDRERVRRWAVVHALAWGVEDGRWLPDHVAVAQALSG